MCFQENIIENIVVAVVMLRNMSEAFVCTNFYHRKATSFAY